MCLRDCPDGKFKYSRNKAYQLSTLYRDKGWVGKLAMLSDFFVPALVAAPLSLVWHILK